MAHVVGVPRRDPCQKCQLPVFLAERLLVGKHVYHRTCLKCARCGSQLTPGCFYETEVNNEYCCETCPDEDEDEEQQPQPAAEQSASASAKAVRNSLSDRLAFFEQNAAGTPSTSTSTSINAVAGHKVLQKSVSDEEKRQHLKEAEEKPAYKGNAALSSFLQRTVDDVDSGANSSSSDEEEEEEQQEKMAVKLEVEKPKVDEQKVEQPKVEEPKVEEPKVEEPKVEETKVEPMPAKRFTTTAQLSLQTVEVPAEQEKEKEPEREQEKEQPKEQIVASSLSTAEEVETTARLNDVSEQLRELAAEQANHKEEKEQKEEQLPSIVPQPKPEKVEPKEEEVKKDDKSNEVPLTQVVATDDKKEKEKVEQEEPMDLQEQPKDTKDEPMDTQEQPKAIKEELMATQELPIATKTEEETTPTKIEEKPTPTKKEEPTPTRKEEEPLATQKEEEKLVEPQVESVEADDKPDEPVQTDIVVKVTPPPITEPGENYPEDLNPFASDEEDDKGDAAAAGAAKMPEPEPKAMAKDISADSLNPFDSSDDEVELEKLQMRRTPGTGGKVPPPRPPPPRISRNPFDEAETQAQTPDSEHFQRRSSLTQSLGKKMPQPAPRTSLSSQSQTPTPEPTPRLSRASNGNSNGNGSQQQSSTALLQRGDAEGRGSNNSLSSSAGGTVRSRKSRRAPVPPNALKELFPNCSEENVSNSNSSLSSSIKSPSSSSRSSPKSARKKRPAPAPPKPARLEAAAQLEELQENGENQQLTMASKNLLSYPLQSELDLDTLLLSDEEKALLEGKPLPEGSRRHSRRLIPLDESLLDDQDDNEEAGGGGGRGLSLDDDQKKQQQQSEVETNAVYRRILMPPNIETPTHEANPLLQQLEPHDRQLEKLKDNKEAQNRTRQSQNSDYDPAFYDKSMHGKWKRRKGPAPALPVPPRKVLQMLPLQEIRHELEIIEVQQQGLEKQGVILEKMIRDRCEGGEAIAAAITENSAAAADATDAPAAPPATPPAAPQNTKEVEDLILQLFELVNEKNELFRRQAELMYLRRQHRLEQEQADIEYEIRVLMGQPERNKTDTDKAREEALIARLVEVVELRNEVIDCLEMDRLREAEEDLSIKQRLEIHNAKREATQEKSKTATSVAKLSKKEKKQQKEAKKLSKSKKLDVDKDADESELKLPQEKTKRKIRKLFF